MFAKLVVFAFALWSGIAYAQALMLGRMGGAVDEGRANVVASAADAEIKLMSLNQAIAENPENPELHLRKGVYLLELGRTQQAFDIFETLRLAHPSHPAPYINLASVFAQQGRLEEARQMLIKADALHAGRYETQLGLAAINMGLALTAMKKASELNSAGDPAVLKKIQEIEQLIAKMNASPTTPSATSDAFPVRAERYVRAEKSIPKPKKIGVVAVTRDLPKGDRLTLGALSSAELSLNRPLSEKEAQRRNLMREVSDEVRTDVMNTVESWASAWSRRDLVEYFSYYSPKFKAANGMKRETWNQYKRNIIERADFINVKISIKQIKIIEKKAFIKLNQQYRSNSHTDSSQKELVMLLEDGFWKIVSEKSI